MSDRRVLWVQIVLGDSQRLRFVIRTESRSRFDMTKHKLLKTVAPEAVAKACLFRDAILESPSLLKQDWLRQKPPSYKYN